MFAILEEPQERGTKVGRGLTGRRQRWDKNYLGESACASNLATLQWQSADFGQRENSEARG